MVRYSDGLRSHVPKQVKLAGAEVAMSPDESGSCMPAAGPAHNLASTPTIADGAGSWT
jgi:hypothetical protein